ncbi:MAG: Gfo/Idh/MocA family oxidoreductase [Candidatus Bathyarchaeia archaeon]
MKQHRIALIGGGHRGIHLMKLMTADPQRVKLVAVAEPREDRREDCRKAFNLPPDAYFRDHRDLLAHRNKFNIDAAVVATNVATHAEVACACLEAGIPIFLEKPMAMTIEEGLRIVEIAERTGVPVQVGFNYAPFFIKTHELAASGEIGTILSIEWAEVIGPRHWADGYCRNPNYGVSASVGTWLLEKSCHDMDQLSWIIGAPCERVASFGSRTYFIPREDVPKKCGEECPRYPNCVWRANLSGKGMASWLRPEEREVCVFHTPSDIVDHQNAILEFEGGAIASFNLNPLGLPERRYFMIYGVDGMIHGDTSTNRIHLRRAGSDVEMVYEPGGAEGGHGGADPSIANAFINFLDDPRNPPKTGVREGFEAVLMACAIEIARRENRVVELEKYRRGLPNRFTT